MTRSQGLRNSGAFLRDADPETPVHMASRGVRRLLKNETEFSVHSVPQVMSSLTGRVPARQGAIAARFAPSTLPVRRCKFVVDPAWVSRVAFGNEAGFDMRSSEPYNVPGPIFTAPCESALTSCIMS